MTEQKLQQLLQDMTLEEKVNQMLQRRPVPCWARWERRS